MSVSPLPLQDQSSDRSSAPSRAPVIACVDGSHRAEEIARTAASYALALERPLILCHLIEHSAAPAGPPDPLDWCLHRQEAHRTLDRLRDTLPEMPNEVALELDEGDWLSRFAERSEKAGALLVIGTEHADEAKQSSARAIRLLASPGIGSLLLVPPGYTPRTSGSPRIAVPIDGSNFAEAALVEAIHLARGSHAELLLVHVIRDAQLSDFGPPATSDLELRTRLDRRNEQAAYRFLERTQRRLVDQGLNVRSLCHKGDPRSTLLRTLSEETPDLIVLSVRGRGGRDCHDLSLGSTAGYLVDHLTGPVMLLGPCAKAGARESQHAPDERQPGSHLPSTSAA